MAVSAAQGLGTGDLLDRLVELLPPEPEADEDAEEPVRLAVIGRPNVGKSSLVNTFLGHERVIVSDVAGTTRDAIDTLLEVDGRQVRLVDTAGIRRQAKVQESVEYYTVLRSQRAAERADVALVVCDANDGVTSQDMRIAELAMKSGCATALVLNKWDLTSGDDFDLDHERARVQRKLRLRPKVMTASALTGRHVQRILVEVLSLADRFHHRIPTPELNRFLGDVVATRPPPQKQGHRLKLLYIAQIGERAAALLDPGQQPRQGHPRLRVLRREPAARALRARGDPGDHRLRRAQAAPPGGVNLPALRAAVRRPLVLAALAAVALLALAGRPGLRAAAATARRPTRPSGSSRPPRWPTSTSRTDPDRAADARFAARAGALPRADAAARPARRRGGAAVARRRARRPPVARRRARLRGRLAGATRSCSPRSPTGRARRRSSAASAT